MNWFIWTLVGIYVAGFAITLAEHLIFLQMVTPSLALLRSAVWPIYLVTGWPHGVPLTMD